MAIFKIQIKQNEIAGIYNIMFYNFCVLITWRNRVEMQKSEYFRIFKFRISIVPQCTTCSAFHAIDFYNLILQFYIFQLWNHFITNFFLIFLHSYSLTCLVHYFYFKFFWILLWKGYHRKTGSISAMTRFFAYFQFFCSPSQERLEHDFRLKS